MEKEEDRILEELGIVVSEAVIVLGEYDSPSRRLMKLTLRILHHRWELAGCDVCLPDSFHEGCFILQANTVMLVRIQNSDRKIQLMPYDANRLYEVGIVRNEHGNIKSMIVAIA